jgi:hypothetical protein
VHETRTIRYGTEAVGKSSLISTFVSRHFSEDVPGVMTRVRLPPDTTTYLPHIGAAPPFYSRHQHNVKTKNDGTSRNSNNNNNINNNNNSNSSNTLHASNYKGFVTTIVDTRHADQVMLEALTAANVSAPKGCCISVSEGQERETTETESEGHSNRHGPVQEEAAARATTTTIHSHHPQPAAAVAGTGGGGGTTTCSSHSASLSSPTNSSGSGSNSGSGYGHGRIISAAEEESHEHDCDSEERQRQHHFELIQKHLGSMGGVDVIVLVYDLTATTHMDTHNHSSSHSSSALMRLEHHWLPLIEKCFGQAVPVILTGSKLDARMSPGARAAQFPLMSSSPSGNPSPSGSPFTMESSTHSHNMTSNTHYATTQQQQQPQNQNNKNNSERQHLASLLHQFQFVRQCLKCSSKALFHVTQVFQKAQSSVLYPLGALYDLSNDQMTAQCARAFSAIFRVWDQDRDGLLSAVELQQFQLHCGRVWGPLMNETLEKWKAAVRLMNQKAAISKGGHHPHQKSAMIMPEGSTTRTSPSTSRNTHDNSQSQSILHNHNRSAAYPPYSEHQAAPPSSVLNVDGKLTVAGFLALMEVFMQKDRFEIPWQILRLHGYNDLLELQIIPPELLLVAEHDSDVPPASPQIRVTTRRSINTTIKDEEDEDGNGNGNVGTTFSRRPRTTTITTATAGGLLYHGLMGRLFRMWPFKHHWINHKRNHNNDNDNHNRMLLPPPAYWDLSRGATDFLIQIFHQFNAKRDGVLSQDDILVSTTYNCNVCPHRTALHCINRSRLICNLLVAVCVCVCV